MPSTTHNDPNSLIASELERTEVPKGVDRRTFLMRSAVIGATAVITGRTISARRRTTAAATAPPPLSPGSRRRQEVQRARDDHDRRVLQGRPGPLELAHDRPDADHLRFLPALRPSCRPIKLAKATALKVHLFGSLSATGKGHGTERAALAGIDRQGAGDGRAGVPRQPARRTRTRVFPVKLGDEDVQRVAQGHHLRRAEGRLPASQHDDLQADGGRQGAARAGVLLGRRRLHRVEGLHAAEEGRAEVPVLDDDGAAGARRARTTSRSRRS